MDGQTRAVGLIGFALWGCAVAGCVVGAAALASSIGWDASCGCWACRLGVGCAWFFFSGPGRSLEAPAGAPRYGPPVGVAGGAWFVSDAYGLFLFSFLAGFIGAPLVVWLTRMARARRPQHAPIRRLSSRSGEARRRTRRAPGDGRAVRPMRRSRDRGAPPGRRVRPPRRPSARTRRSRHARARRARVRDAPRTSRSSSRVCRAGSARRRCASPSPSQPATSSAAGSRVRARRPNGGS